MEYQFDYSEVEMINTKGINIAFRKDGKEYHTVGEACHTNSPPDTHQTYNQTLVCVGDEEFEGRLYFDVTRPNAEDASDACNWCKFDVYF